MRTVGSGAYPWTFKARFRRQAFGWRSQPAIQRIREAVTEIKRVARHDPTVAADGAITLLERLSPALERVDSSSGAIGTAVNKAIAVLVPIIADAPADPATRGRWLERLWAAHEADEIPYIELLGDYWGDLCASGEVASRWADALIDTARLALSPDPQVRGFFHGTSACLSALYRAGRYDELVDLVRGRTIWHYAQWAERARTAILSRTSALGARPDP